MSSSSYLGGILNQHKKSGVDKPGRFILSERKDLCDDLAIEGTILNHSDTCPRELNFVHKSKGYIRFEHACNGLHCGIKM